MTYYDILQIAPIATPEAIKAAYRRLALAYHPDTNKAPDAHDMFIRLQTAFRVLSKPTSRATYDRTCSIETPRVAAAAPQRSSHPAIRRYQQAQGW